MAATKTASPTAIASAVATITTAVTTIASAVTTKATTITAKAVLIGIRTRLATQGILLQTFPIDIGVGSILRRIGTG
jgi:hypothetical protein